MTRADGGWYLGVAKLIGRDLGFALGKGNKEQRSRLPLLETKGK